VPSRLKMTADRELVQADPLCLVSRTAAPSSRHHNRTTQQHATNMLKRALPVALLAPTMMAAATSSPTLHTTPRPVVCRCVPCQHRSRCSRVCADPYRARTSHSTHLAHLCSTPSRYSSPWSSVLPLRPRYPRCSCHRAAPMLSAPYTVGLPH
jgi:hypothetical protein